LPSYQLTDSGPGAWVNSAAIEKIKPGIDKSTKMILALSAPSADPLTHNPQIAPIVSKRTNLATPTGTSFESSDDFGKLLAKVERNAGKIRRNVLT